MIGILIITIFALIISIILVTFNKQENKAEEYLKRLPGFNCGGCGYGSCEGMAEAMCKSIENYKKCKPLKGEKLEEMEEYLDGRNH